MATVAARPPVAAGVNVTVKAQLADAATGPPARGRGATPEPATAKSPGFEPARAMLVMLRVAVPLLVWFLMSRRPPRSRRFPYTALFRSSVAVGGVTPVPVSDTDCGLPGASSVMVTVAVRAPAAAGVNVRQIAKPHVATPGTTGSRKPSSPGPATANALRLQPARAVLVSLRVAV